MLLAVVTSGFVAERCDGERDGQEMQGRLVPRS